MDTVSAHSSDRILPEGHPLNCLEEEFAQRRGNPVVLARLEMQVQTAVNGNGETPDSLTLEQAFDAVPFLRGIAHARTALVIQNGELLSDGHPLAHLEAAILEPDALTTEKLALVRDDIIAALDSPKFKPNEVSEAMRLRDYVHALVVDRAYGEMRS